MYKHESAYKITSFKVDLYKIIVQIKTYLPKLGCTGCITTERFFRKVRDFYVSARSARFGMRVNMNKDMRRELSDKEVNIGMTL